MPLKDVEPGTKTVEEKIDEILEDTSTTLEDKLDAIKLIIDDILIDTNATLENKLDAIKPIVDAILEDTSVTLEDKMDALNTLLTTAEAEIDAIEAKLDNATYGLNALKILLDALEIKLDDATYGLSALQKLILGIEWNIENVNWGLYAISSLIAAVEGKLDVPANFMADVTALALEATLSTHDIDIKTLINSWLFIIADDIIFGFTTLETLIDAVEGKLDHATYGLSALNTDLDKLLTGIIQGTGTVLPANKSLYDLLWIDKSTDEQGSFNWDTSAYTTNEQDISALFTTALTGTKRREYQVYLDLSNVEGDANFDECYIRVYVKINGTYQCIDKATKTKADLQAEPGVPIEVPKTAEDAKVTLEMKTALAGDQTIDYSWVEEKMEY